MDNQIQVISEEIRETNILISENKSKEKEYWIEGIFLQAEVKNGNRRIYPKKVLSEAVKTYQNKFMKRNNGFGELGHPDNGKINWQNVCLITKELREDGNNYIGKAKIITENPMGKIVKNLMDEGCQLAVSSRGMGQIKNGIVQNGFKLVAAVDIVHEPSAPDAFVQNLIEQKEWIMENGILIEREMEEMRDEILDAPSKEINHAKNKAWKKFLENVQKS